MKIDKIKPLSCNKCGSTSVFKEGKKLYCIDVCKKVFEKGKKDKPIEKKCYSKGEDPRYYTNDYIEGKVGVHEY